MAHERILVVDDEPGVRSALEGILRDEGFVVTSVASGEEGIEAASAGPFDAVLLDIWLPGRDGLETLLELRDRRVDAEVVMISGHGTIETAVKATKLGAFDFIEKPLSLEKTLLVLRNALRQRRLERKNRTLLEQLDRDTEIVGTSPAARAIRGAIDSAARSDAPVLICGERGTGRETVARRLHASSTRSEEAFVGIPCGALDARSASETLFGGRIELAKRGTLFLEDADRLDPSLQERLAALLVRGRLDSPDVRVVASVGPDPATLSRAFRDRLEVVRIDVPPLRERGDDVILLAERFMRELSREYGRDAKRFEPESLAALKAYAWPGNVRELRNVVEGILLLGPGERVAVADLPEGLGGARRPTEDLYRDFATLAEGIETFERYYLRRMLAETRGDKDAAARRSGIERKLLDARMRDLGLG